MPSTLSTETKIRSLFWHRAFHWVSASWRPIPNPAPANGLTPWGIVDLSLRPWEKCAKCGMEREKFIEFCGN